MISVTRVKVTPDLKYAKVYVSMLNSKSVEKTMQGLKDSAGFMRSQVARMVNLRITPELVFEYDDSIEHGERIDNILKQISEQDKAIKEINNIFRDSTTFIMRSLKVYIGRNKNDFR